MDNSIQQMQNRASQAIVLGQFKEAIDLYSRIITFAEDKLNDQRMSLLFVQRAGCFILSQKFEDSLTDSETAISLDTHNVLGHIQKAKALLNLHKVKEAREAIRIGRNVANDHELFDELERTISDSWFTLGQKGLKLIATLTLTVGIGILTNLIGGFSGWKQGIIARVLFLIAFFIHLHRLHQFVINMFYAFRHNHIWHRRSGSSSGSSIGNAAQNNACPQSDTNRFLKKTCWILICYCFCSFL